MFTQTTNAADKAIDALERVTSPGDLLPIVRDNAYYVHGQIRRGFSAQIDFHDADRRICIEWNMNYDHYTYSILSGYDAEKHCWTNYNTREHRVEFTSKRGLKACQEFIRTLAQIDYGQPGRNVSAYRDANRAAGWKTY